jgi:hypothetical protein
MIEKWHPTVLCDEFERWDKSDDAIGILNSGHDRGGAFIWRNVLIEKNHEPKKFSTWSPKAFAQIGKGIDSALLERSIHVRLSKKKAGLRKAKLPVDGSTPPHIKPLCGKCARWTQDNLRLLALGLPTTKLDNRIEDNWTPLFKAAMAAGGQWYNRLIKIALVHTGAEGENDQDNRVTLLHDVYGLFAQNGVERLSGQEVVEAIVQLENRPYAEWKHDRAISKYQLSRELSEFNIISDTLKFPDGRKAAAGYRLADFKRPLSEYPLKSPSELITSLQPLQGNGLGASPLITEEELNSAQAMSSDAQKSQETNGGKEVMSSNAPLDSYLDDESDIDIGDDYPELAGLSKRQEGGQS